MRAVLASLVFAAAARSCEDRRPQLDRSCNRGLFGRGRECGRDLFSSDLAVIESTPADLAAIFDAVQPVYDTLEENLAFAAALDEIRLVKEELGAPPATLRCGGPGHGSHPSPREETL